MPVAPAVIVNTYLPTGVVESIHCLTVDTALVVAAPPVVVDEPLKSFNVWAVILAAFSFDVAVSIPLNKTPSVVDNLLGPLIDIFHWLFTNSCLVKFLAMKPNSIMYSFSPKVSNGFTIV